MTTQNIANIPAPRVDFIDPRTGLMSREWYRFLFNLFTLTGSGTNNISLSDVHVGREYVTGPQTTIQQKSNAVLTWLSM